MIKPTPRPWQIDGEDEMDGWQFILISAGTLGTRSFRKICEVQPNDFPDFEGKLTDEDTANAAHIVKCVNMHDGLLNLLTHLCSEITSVERDAILHEARGVLAKAEAE